MGNLIGNDFECFLVIIRGFLSIFEILIFGSFFRQKTQIRVNHDLMLNQNNLCYFHSFSDPSFNSQINKNSSESNS